MICFVRTLLPIDFLLLVLTCCLFPLSLSLSLLSRTQWRWYVMSGHCHRLTSCCWFLPYRFPPKCLFVLFLTFSAQIHPRQCVNKIWLFTPTYPVDGVAVVLSICCEKDVEDKYNSKTNIVRHHCDDWAKLSVVNNEHPTENITNELNFLILELWEPWKYQYSRDSFHGEL